LTGFINFREFLKKRVPAGRISFDRAIQSFRAELIREHGETMMPGSEDRLTQAVKFLCLSATAMALTLVGFVGTTNSQPQVMATARGRVFHDANENGIFDDVDKPLSGIRVSNGLDLVTTDANGAYSIPVDDDTIVFVIKPRGWRTPLSEDNLPRFYYIHKPAGSPDLRYPGVAPTGPLPASIDFPLYPQEEPERFEAILFGDTQPRNLQEVDWIAQDVIPDLIGTKAAFGVTLGDIAFDDLSVMRPLNQAIALIGIPWYNVAGNHDLNYDASSRKTANETFESIYGPSYYSFEYGPVHFIVLDDIEWRIDDGTGKATYRGGLGPEQLQFVKQDLAAIPHDQMVVLMMHIPIIGVHDRQELYRLIEHRPFCLSISGHTHHHEHVWIKKEDGWEGPAPHHHIINVTVCGSWWSGAPDERGIPHTTMADGAPNGYSILRFDGNSYQLDYRAAGRPADYQMEIDAPSALKFDATEGREIAVNVFNGSEKMTVEMRVGSGPWDALEQRRAVDPIFQKSFDRESKILTKLPAFRMLPRPKPSSHVWFGELPANLPIGTHPIEVTARDHWGRVFTDRRIVRIEE
jgi:hypothetical protein